MIPIKASYDMTICILSYMFAGEVFNALTNGVVSWFWQLMSLGSIAILVYFAKKRLARKDHDINKDGGFLSFLKALALEKYSDNCLETKEDTKDDDKTGTEG